MAYSVQSDVSNGTLQYIEVRINYFDKAHLSVTVDELVIPQGNSATEYWWIWDGNRIKMNKAVANGKEVKVRRSTPIGEPLHTFRQGATFKDSTVDENFLQQLYINQENFEGRSGTDIYNDMNHHGYRITSVAPAIAANDAVPFSQYRADSLGATQQRLLAEAANNSAIAARDAANSSKNAAATSATNAANSASTATTKASEALTSANNAASSASTANTKASEAAASATSAQNWANAASATAIPNGSLTTVMYGNASVTLAKLGSDVTGTLTKVGTIEANYVTTNTIQDITAQKRYNQGALYIKAGGGSFGGDVRLAKAPNSTLMTDYVTVDCYQNQIRTFALCNSSGTDWRGTALEMSDFAVGEFRKPATVALGTNPNIRSDGAAPMFCVRAWGVHGNGTTFRAGNCTVAKLTTGIYRVTFDTPMPHDNYAVSIVTEGDYGICRVGAVQVGLFEIIVANYNASALVDTKFRFSVTC